MNNNKILFETIICMKNQMDDMFRNQSKLESNIKNLNSEMVKLGDFIVQRENRLRVYFYQKFHNDFDNYKEKMKDHLMDELKKEQEKLYHRFKKTLKEKISILRKKIYNLKNNENKNSEDEKSFSYDTNENEKQISNFSNDNFQQIDYNESTFDSQQPKDLEKNIQNTNDIQSNTNLESDFNSIETSSNLPLQIEKPTQLVKENLILDTRLAMEDAGITFRSIETKNSSLSKEYQSDQNDFNLSEKHSLILKDILNDIQKRTNEMHRNDFEKSNNGTLDLLERNSNEIISSNLSLMLSDDDETETEEEELSINIPLNNEKSKKRKRKKYQSRNMPDEKNIIKEKFRRGREITKKKLRKVIQNEMKSSDIDV